MTPETDTRHSALVLQTVMATKTKRKNWLEILKNARKSSLVQDGRWKVHYTFDDRELVEEYDIKAGLLVVRKWKRKTSLGAEKKWEYEIGEDLSTQSTAIESNYIVESKCNPMFVRKDTKESFQWRIRNLPFPIDFYDLSVDESRTHIVIKTKNKKYYKKFNIPDMIRHELALDAKSISIAHANNTLIIKYAKPREILEQEKLILKELEKKQHSREGDVECNPS
ncbi:protein DPCD-like [Xenia sp. Carnegie-2017]|uniref:protein DPCD-like n=1 Tax=Xenia sp. Carnegie-2017 TaxID=2897299 RepID=UPI001F03C5B8|nr:protein DPCD-like [Xenia sp. Carnegie-2017]